jgi:chaperone LolA
MIIARGAASVKAGIGKQNPWPFLAACRVLPVAAFLLLAVAAPAQELDREHLALRRFLDGLESFSATFDQRLYSEFGEELEHASGRVYIQRPGRFQWSYLAPYSQTIVSDGVTLWVHDADLEQATVRDATHSLDDSPAAILDGSGDIDAHYLIVDAGLRDGIEWIELTPRNADSDYTSIRLGFAGGNLAAMVLFDNLGQKTEITFGDVARNPRLDPALFTFTPPPGLDIIDTRGQ